MENDLTRIFKEIDHPEKRMSIHYIGVPGDDIFYYCFTLSYNPEILSDLKKYEIDLDKDFLNEMSEFGGIVNYKGDRYIKRINLNLSNEMISEIGNGFSFYQQSKNSEKEDLRNLDENSGESFSEYFLINDILSKLVPKFNYLFENYRVDYDITLSKHDLILRIWPYDKDSIRL